MLRICDDDSSDLSDQVHINRASSEKKKSKRKLVESKRDLKHGLLNVRHKTLDDFLDARKHLRVDRDESNAQHVTINSDEELWIFQCPKNIEVEELLGRKLDLSQPVQLIPSKKGSKEFECKLELTKYENHLTIISPTNVFPEAVSVKQAGMITIRERINLSKRKSNVNGDINANSNDKLFWYPTNLKIRHPLLGVDFDKIEIKEEKDDSFVSSSRKENKKKKDRVHDGSDRITVKQEPDVEFLVTSAKSEKKRKKRSRDDSNEIIKIKQEPNEEETLRGSPKKDKHSKKARLSDRDTVRLKIKTEPESTIED